MKRATRPDIPDMLRFLAHSGRREMLVFLGEGPKTVRELSTHTRRPPASLRPHLRLMTQWKLIRPMATKRPQKFQLTPRVGVLFFDDRAAVEIRDLPSGKITLTTKRRRAARRTKRS